MRSSVVRSGGSVEVDRSTSDSVRFRPPRRHLHLVKMHRLVGERRADQGSAALAGGGGQDFAEGGGGGNRAAVRPDARFGGPGAARGGHRQLDLPPGIFGPRVEGRLGNNLLAFEQLDLFLGWHQAHLHPGDPVETDAQTRERRDGSWRPDLGANAARP